ncbi:MAG TPA: serine hydrolase domain-containing protein [Thermoanaerobaculia bacterium]|nr:serine hydrolase domain-containing protein [Thermoanaerobaculia bacterium]
MGRITNRRSSRREKGSAVARWLALCVVCSQALGGQEAIAIGGPDAVARNQLVAEELLAAIGERPLASEPAASLAFAVPEAAAPAAHRFEGRLVVGSGPSRFRLLHDGFGLGAPSGIQRLPEFEVTFVQDESHLIPRDPGLLHTGHERWNLIVGAGRVWSEEGDRGRSRAAFPFALVERGQNCTHNGVATFLFDDVTVSSLAYQVTQETCFYFRFDLWGRASAHARTETVPSRRELVERHRRELESRLPTRPIESLATGEGAPSLLDALRGEPEHLTTFGLVLGGVHYTATPRTRTGPAAFPDALVLPSYSLAKSAFAAVALMRLAQRDGLEVADLRLREWVPTLASSGANGSTDWSGVRFEDALDMATGHYRSPVASADEGDERTGSEFFRRESLDDKLAAASDHPRREDPGARWVYHTTDTFLLTYAMLRYGAAHGDGDLFELVARDVYQPIGLSAMARASSLRTGNRPDGVPLGGYGLFFTADDIAKLALFLGRDQGRIDGRQLLHPGLLAKALQRDPSDRGLPALHHGEPRLYNNGFWAMRLEPGEPGEGRETWVPLMLGYGGIAVALIGHTPLDEPSADGEPLDQPLRGGGAVYYHVRDDYRFHYQRAIRALDAWSRSSPPG